MDFQIIQTDRAPAAIGPYSQGIIANGFLFTAGQIALDPKSGEIIGDDIQTQTRQALTNLQAVVQAADISLENVVKMTLFLSDMNDFSAMNQVYEQFFTQHKPARSAVEVSRLPKDALVEVEAVAVLEK
ncbi:MAG: hypothetical protein B6244_14590 [Candidatus Cloacimonetes bacterium 4572_55]|nr:MAG: hypothetical protein B6244_14590 [Candidatus Cloacimonetes bacterium 4572_55]